MFQEKEAAPMPGIQKRGFSYRITVSCGYDAKGKQIRKTKTYRPMSGMTQHQIEKEVQRVAMVFEATVKNGEYTDSGKIRLADFCPLYLEIAAKSLAPMTLSAYERIIDQHIIPVLGHFRLSEIRPFHVQMFVQYLQTPGSGRHQEILSPSSVRRYFTVLQSILGRAYKLGLNSSDPADSERIELPAMDPKPTDIFSQEETTQLLHYLNNEPMRFQLLIHLAILTGCRRGELMALTWKDIDWNNRIITISKSNYRLAGQEVATKAPKTRSSIRKVTIPGYCIDMLQEYQTEQKEKKLYTQWIFSDENGNPLPPLHATRWFSDFLKRNGLPHRKFHALRHTSATLLLLHGTNIKTVAARLGHNQLSTTNRYVHSILDADVDAANLLSDLLITNDTDL